MGTSDQLNRKQLLAVCHYAGFRGDKLVLACAVVCPESGRRYSAIGVNPNGSEDRGLFQINSIHEQEISEHLALLPIPNAQFAYKLSKEGKDFSPWAAYNAGKHEKFIPEYEEELLQEKDGEWVTSIAERENVFDRVGYGWVPRPGS